jgi:hypothetical protein
MILSFYNLLAQSFEGLYSLQGAEATLVLKAQGDQYTGFMLAQGSKTALKGEVQLGILVLMLDNSDDKTMTYGAFDENGLLVLTDDHLNIAYFKKTGSADGEAALAVSNKQTETVISPPTTGKLSQAAGKYAGKKFLHMYTGNGYSEKWSYSLFADGSFLYQGDNSYLSNDASSSFSAAGQSRNSGTWNVSAANGIEYLDLLWSDGDKGRLQITRNSDGYLLNKTKYWLVGLNEY